MSSGTETPRKRRSKGRQRPPANGSTPSTAAAASGGSGGGSGGGGGGDSGSCPSAKKLKIFDYFGVGTPSTPKTPKESAERAAGSGRREDAIGGSGGGRGRIRPGEVYELAKTAPKPIRMDSGSIEKSQAAASPPAPTWGKMVDPRKARRWEMVRCLQEGSGGGGGGGPVDPTAWARRSYSLNYSPLFQDARTPGMGSTGVSWGWASHSQVFGGAQASVSPSLALDPPAGDTADVSSGGLDSQAKEQHSGQRRSADKDGCAVARREGLDHPEGVESEENCHATAAAAAAVAATAAAAATAGKRRRRVHQNKNFEVMISWLSSSFLDSGRTPAPADRVDFASSEAFSTAAAVAGSTEKASPAKSLLEVALERQDGGPAAAFMTLRSLTPQVLQTEEETGDDPAGECRPVALALRFYHAGSTWQRVSRWPAPRRRGQGPGCRLHPDDPALAAAVDEADYSDRLRRSIADFDAAVALLDAGLATPLRASTNGIVKAGGSGGSGGGSGRGGVGSLCFGRGGGGGGGGDANGGSSGGGKYGLDPLAALAPREVLTAVETRSLTKALGIPPTVARESRIGGGGVCGTNGASSGGVMTWSGTNIGPARGRRGAGGRSGSGGGGGGGGGSERATVDSKDETCQAFEQWLTRPTNLAKKRARLARAVRQTVDLVASGGAWAGRTERDSSGGGGGGRGSGSGSGSGSDGRDGVCVIRLADDAREAIHRVHVAFFAAARHGPHDVPSVLREDLAHVLFGGAGGHGGGGVGDGGGGSGGRGGGGGGGGDNAGDDGMGAVEVARCRHPAPPQILSSVEAFAEYYRLVTLADVMDFAASAGDAGLAYGSLHEASTALLPSGCPLCRLHLQRLRRGNGGSGSGSGARAVGDCQGVTAAVVEHPPPPPPPPRCCDICGLSARVVMRGVGLMERDKDYNNAFHYLEILLQAPSQRMSVHRPRYWLRLVTDLCHKKRFTEALRACEKALAEASPAPSFGDSGAFAVVDATRPPSGVLMPVTSAVAVAATAAVGAASSAAAGAAAAAVFPLGESLPLLRRAVRLAVPPLRWRKRPPPRLNTACLRVMRFDLSWRRLGGSGGGGSGGGSGSGSGNGNGTGNVNGGGSGVGGGSSNGGESGNSIGNNNGNGHDNGEKSGDRRGDEYPSSTLGTSVVGGPTFSSPGLGSRAHEGQTETDVDTIIIDEEEEDENEKMEQNHEQGREQEREQKLKHGRPKTKWEDEEEVGCQDKKGGGVGRKGSQDSEGSAKIASGTSLEDAVLDKMLAELGPEWTGLHAENSICLGLFALLCWDALFATFVPAAAAAAAAVAPVLPLTGTLPTSITSEEPSDAHVPKQPEGVAPPQRGARDGAASGCRGEDERWCTAPATIRQVSPPIVAGGDAQNRTVAVCDGGPGAPTLREEEGEEEEEEEEEGDAVSDPPFPSKYQSEPADLMTVGFAGRRRRLLEGVFASVEKGRAAALVRRNWSRHYGEACTGLNWNLFAGGVEGWVTVACAIGPLPLSRICRNLSSNYWAWRHGLPDLFLWRKDAARTADPAALSVPTGPTGSAEPAGSSPAQGRKGGAAPETNAVVVDVDAEPSLPTAAVANIHDSRKGTRGVAAGGAFCKWVEVKGPGDDLSCAQEAWIDTFVGAGAEAVLLRVEDAAAAAGAAAASPR